MAGKKKPGIPVKSINIKLRMINDLIDVTGSAEDSWNPAEISDDMKAIAYIHDLADTWNPAQLNEALKYLGFATIDSWNPAIIEETKNKLVKYFLPTDSSGNPIELNLKGVFPYDVTSLTIDLLPIQDLSHGDPSPTNICPISGRTEVSVTRTEINQWDEQWESGTINNSTGQNQSGGTNRIRSKGYISVSPDTTYYLYNSSGVNCFIYRYRKNKTFIGITAGAGSVGLANTTFTTDSDCYYVRFRTNDNYGTTYRNNISINYPSTDTSYHAYQGETVTVQFEQTVYGGNVNILEGGTSSNYGYIASYDGEELPGAWISDRDAYAAGTSPTTGAEVAYVLTTPTELNTPANKIALVNGENILSTDGDTINITYKANLNS